MIPIFLTDLGQLRFPGCTRNSKARIAMDCDPTDVDGIALDVQPGSASGNERAGVQLGDFFFGQDTAKNGTKNVGLVDASGNLVELLIGSRDALTAFATGGQTNATALQVGPNRITVCATAGDSVKLPASVAGAIVILTHNGATAADVFPATGEAINNLGANAAFRQPNNTQTTFVCNVVGTWSAQLPTRDAKFTTRALSTSTAAAGELTGAKVVTMNNSGANPGNYTTRTAAQMIADGFYQVGDSYNLRIVNGQGTGVLTVVAGDGNVTLTGTMTLAINSFRDFVVTITAAGTLTIQSVATGTFS